VVDKTQLKSIAVAVSYLMALCESDRKMQLLDVVKNIDIIKLLSAESIENIFQSLGRLQLESVAEDILLDLRARGMIMILFSLNIFGDGIRRGALFCLLDKTLGIYMCSTLYYNCVFLGI